jgi:hypothetical protein
MSDFPQKLRKYLKKMVAGLNAEAKANTIYGIALLVTDHFQSRPRLNRDRPLMVLLNRLD